MYPAQMALSPSENDAAQLELQYGTLLDQSAFLKDRTNLQELSGGLTNRNIAITTPTGKYVARISSNDSSYLSINRDSEFANTKVAAESGVGAPVYDFLPGQGLLVIGYLDGHTFDSGQVRSNLDRVAIACRKLHTGKMFDREFNMFDIQQSYQKIVLEKGFRIPSDYQELSGEVKHLKRVLAVNSEPLVPCNNDLLPGNFIDNGTDIFLIDYEYSGNNDRCFELGNIWSEAVLETEALEELVTHYFGGDRPEQFARAWLYAVMAKYGWTLWASIQDGISSIDFDFWNWGMEKYEDSRRLFASARYNEMLEMALK